MKRIQLPPRAPALVLEKPDKAKHLANAEYMSLFDQTKRKMILDNLKSEEALDLYYDWRNYWARPKQLPPDGPCICPDRRCPKHWTRWVFRAGRGSGKTRSGAGWVHERAMQSKGRWIALVARTPADARDYMIEGPGGLLRNTHPRERPRYEPSNRRLVWPNGSWATVYSDAEPDQVRGFSGDTAWLDEFCKFQNPQMTWDNLQFGMRESSDDHPRLLITTTPRPLPILKQIEAMPGSVVVLGTSYDNRSNLDPKWFEDVIKPYEGTRLGRQEISAEILDDLPGALWTRAMLDAAQLRGIPREQLEPRVVRKKTWEDIPEDERVYPSTIGVF